MEQIKKIIRPNILALSPYSCARMEYAGEASIYIDANENPNQTDYNRYPDPQQVALKERLSILKLVRPEQIVIGNGSDELIDLLIRTFCEPNIDFIIDFSPGYGMYRVCAQLSNVEVKELMLSNILQPDWSEVSNAITENCKLIFLCTPNNPIGNEIPLENIAHLASTFEGVVVVDEAYIDFGSNPSATTLIENYPNIVVLQTLSKAWGLAGLRLGVLYANPYIVKIINSVKPPYNVSSLSQNIALERLANTEQFETEVSEIKKQREIVIQKLSELSYVEEVYPSQGNFVLLTSKYSNEIFETLLSWGIVVRRRDIPPIIVGGLRISIGTPAENQKMLGVLENINFMAVK